MSGPIWIDTDDGKLLCTTHGGAPFERVGYCPGCRKDPGAEPGFDASEPLPPPPPGCMSTEQLERTMINDARRVKYLIKALGTPTDGEDYHGINAIAKLYEVRLKFLRAAAECARGREHEEITERRDRRDRAMQQASAGKAD